MEVGERVFVEIVGKTGTLLGWDSRSYEVRLEDDPEHVSRWYAHWDVESIEPYPAGYPEGERLQRIGEQIICEKLDEKAKGECPSTQSLH